MNVVFHTIYPKGIVVFLFNQTSYVCMDTIEVLFFNPYARVFYMEDYMYVYHTE